MLPASGAQVARKRTEDGGFARTVGADEHGDASWHHGEVDAVHERLLAVADGKVVRDKSRCLRRNGARVVRGVGVTHRGSWHPPPQHEGDDDGGTHHSSDGAHRELHGSKERTRHQVASAAKDRAHEEAGGCYAQGL